MAMEFVDQIQFVSSVPGQIQVTGIQPVALNFASATSSATFTVNTDMSDPLVQQQGALWLRIDDTNPNVAIPTLGTTVSENTAPVITATVQQMDAPTAV